MASQSVQVNIVGAGARVDTTMPIPLQNRISTSDWDSFCTELQSIINEARQAAFRRLAPFGVLFLVGFIIFISGIVKQTQSTSFDDGPPASIFAGFALMPVAMIGACLALTSQSGKHEAKVMDLCKSMSDKHATLSFHFKQVTFRSYDGPNSTRSYIEIIFADDALQVPQSNYDQNEIPSAQAIVIQDLSDIESATSTPQSKDDLRNDGGGNTFELPPATAPMRTMEYTAAASPSLAERLSNLESVKSVLSAEEYESKRREILDSM